MFFSKVSRKMEGPGYIILNVLRVINIISLILVVVGSWIMMVRTVQTSNFFFFDATSHFIIQATSLFLIVSELGLFKGYYERNWPLLSNNSGLVFLGTVMIILGFDTLGNLNKPATSVDNLGLPLWRVVIAGGVLCSLLGLFNIIAGCVFSNKGNHITSRQVRSNGAASPQNILPKSSGSVSSSSSHRPPSPILPTYHENQNERRRSRFGLHLPYRTQNRNSKLEISRPVATDPEQFKKWEDRSSPVVPAVQRPPTAMHPAYSPSRYSVASRF